MESQIALPLEQALGPVKGIRSIESSSMPGVSTVFVRLSDNVEDVDQSWAEVQDKISEASDKLPKRASFPVLTSDQRWGSYSSLFSLVDTSNLPNSMSVLARWGKEIEDRIRFVPGTRFTELFGVPEEEILVEVTDESLAKTGLTIAQIAERIQGRDSEVSNALAKTPRRDIPIHMMGDIAQLHQLEKVMLLADADGKQLQLGSIATVSRRERTPARTKAFVGGHRSVVIASRMNSASHIDTWSKSQRKVIDEIRAMLPAGLELNELYQQKRYTDRRTHSLYTSLGLGMILVSIIVCLMMGWRAAIPICSALPLTLLGVFFLMMPFSIDLHQMSISGLILALGILIDNPIIVVDNIHRRMSDGATAEEAVIAAVQHVKRPLIASNATTILAFTPVLLLPGPTGEFLEQLGWTVIASLAISLLLSLTLIPVLAAWCLGLFWSAPSSSTESGWFGRALKWIFQKPVAVVAASIVLPLLGFAVAGDLRQQFFPSAERDHFQFTIKLPPLSPLGESERIAFRAREILLGHDVVEDVSLFIGSNAPKIHYSLITSDEYQPHFSQGIVQLKTNDAKPFLLRQIQSELNEQLPSAQIIVSRLDQGPPAVAPIEFRIYGPSNEKLHQLGTEARRTLMSVPGIIHTRTSLNYGGVQLGLDVKQHESNSADLNDSEIARQIFHQLEGVSTTRLSENTEEIPIRVRIKNADNTRPERAMSLPIISPAGRLIPLGSVAQFKIENTPYHVYRRNLSPCNIVSAFVAVGELPVVVENRFRKALRTQDFELPAGYRMDFGGISQERKSAVGNLYSYAAIVCTLMLTLLVATFRSFRLAAIIGFVGLLSVGLGLLNLWLFQYPIGIVAIIGVLGMMGLAINDSIVVLTDCHRDADLGIPIALTVQSSTRHVLTTTLTTVAGVLPLILAGGEFWPPMMIVIAGGVVGATLLALGLTPSLYQLSRKRNL